MVERREDFSFPLKPREPVGIRGKVGRQDLECDIPLEAGVASAIHLAHATRAKGRDDLVGAESSARCERHRAAILSVSRA